MSNSVATNLRRFRKLRKLTQKEAANMVGISRVAYRNIETGKAEPRASTMEALSEALNIDLFSLVSKVPQAKSLRFRARKTLSAYEQAEREQEIIETINWLSDFNELEDALGKTTACSVSPVRSKPSSIPEFAEKVRKNQFKIECEGCVPNICDVLEQNGVKVRITDSNIKGFFGFSVGSDDGGPAVVVNKRSSIPVERQIFTAAHELGHLFLHQSSFNPDETNENDAQEKEADTFAAYFLMPAERFESEWERNKGLHWVDRVLKTKRTFRVSWMTVLYRLCELGLADKTTIYPQFRKAYEDRTGRHFKYEPEDGAEPAASRKSSEEPVHLNQFDFFEDRFLSLVRDALEQDVVSVSRAAEMLDVTVNETLELLEEWEAHG